ncbi:PFL_4669 family integrating conjugative element protein [Pseudomonas gingeri]
MSDHLLKSLGPLRSSIELTLHTYHAVRVWQGRPADENKPAIIGFAGFVRLMNRMKLGAAQDDPYSDFWMIRMQEKLESSKADLTMVRRNLDQLMSLVPEALSVSETLNTEPVKVPVFINSPFGFLALYLIVAYDNFVRQAQQCHYVALMSRRDMEHWINSGGRVLRSLFGFAQQYKFSGATRADFAADNDVARQAQERFGTLPLDVLEGTRRSEFAPAIMRRRVQGREGVGEGVGASSAPVSAGAVPRVSESQED